MASEKDGIFSPTMEATVPSLDVVSYAFENYKQHINRKVRIPIHRTFR